jgi:hypothetical protein
LKSTGFESSLVLWDTWFMAKPTIAKLLIYHFPKLTGICQDCGKKFEGDTRDTIQQQFTEHDCTPLDSSQNALRIVREATENK